MSSIPSTPPDEFKIKRESPIPLYFQVENIIQHQILAGIFRPGDQLPTEQELCERFRVSRSVIRPALQNLVNHHLIERIPGKGTFVSRQKIQESLIKELLGFYEDTLLQGHQPSTQTLEQRLMPVPSELAANLAVQPEEPVLFLKRLRYVNQEPHLLSETYLRIDRLPGIHHQDFNQTSLYDILSDRYGLVISHGKRVVEAILAQEEEAGLLGIQPGAAILKLSSLVFLDDEQPIEYSIGKHRADRTRFEVDLVRTQRVGKTGDRLRK